MHHHGVGDDHRGDAWGAKTRGIGEFGDGELEHLRQWLGAQWPSLSSGECRATQSRQMCPGEAHEPSAGIAKEAFSSRWDASTLCEEGGHIGL